MLCSGYDVAEYHLVDISRYFPRTDSLIRPKHHGPIPMMFTTVKSAIGQISSVQQSTKKLVIIYNILSLILKLPMIAHSTRP